MHLYKPEDPYFAGDCMPFYQDGVFHLFYLLDENHHQGMGGLGGHQWAHATTTDLVHWQQHPLALAIEQPWEASICTGSAFWHAGIYYAFYATRMPDWTQHLCVATSQDGIHFEKYPGNPLMSPPAGFGRFDFRDPFAFQDERGDFHLLVTAKLDPFSLYDRGGCLLRLSSTDLLHWQVQEPFFIPGGGAGYRCVPECSDTFRWNDWYYLVYSLGLQTRYRISRGPSGPWQKPVVDLLDCPFNAVIKTSPIWDNRRIAVGFVGTRNGDRDVGAVQWAGNIVFRELVQHADGTLGTRFVPEMSRSTGERVEPRFEALTSGASFEAGQICLEAGQTQEAGALFPVPQNFRLRCRVQPQNTSARFGLGLRGAGRLESQYELSFEPGLGQVQLADQKIEGVDLIRQPFEIEVAFQGDIVEVCIHQQRCIINRLPELRGERLFFFCEYGTVVFQDIGIF